jgi:hypothetical protein
MMMIGSCEMCVLQKTRRSCSHGAPGGKCSSSASDNIFQFLFSFRLRGPKAPPLHHRPGLCTLRCWCTSTGLCPCMRRCGFALQRLRLMRGQRRRRMLQSRELAGGAKARPVMERGRHRIEGGGSAGIYLLRWGGGGKVLVVLCCASLRASKRRACTFLIQGL